MKVHWGEILMKIHLGEISLKVHWGDISMEIHFIWKNQFSDWKCVTRTNKEISSLYSTSYSNTNRTYKKNNLKSYRVFIKYCVFP